MKIYSAYGPTTTPKRTFLYFIVFFFVMLFLVILNVQATSATIEVNTTTNSQGDSKCSLQEAIYAANYNVASDACSAGSTTPGDIDIITFNITGTGVHTITLSYDEIIHVVDPVYIDGSSQPGHAGVPLIEIKGDTEDIFRFTIDTDNSTIKGLRLNNTNTGGRVDGAGILLYSKNNHIIGNYFNTDGVSVVGNHGAGLLLDESATGNMIGGTTAEERNLFGGQVGIYFQDSSYNKIQGNYFGVQSDGITALTDLPKNGSAIQIFTYLPTGKASNNTVLNNIITGFLVGVNLSYGASSNTITGNYIGVGADGTTRLGNGTGVFIYGAQNNAIGGGTVATRNVISGNESTNITVQPYGTFPANDNVIQRNYIGLDATGQGTFSPPTLMGIYVTGGTTGSIINKGNVIGGNEVGVYIDAMSEISGGSSQNCFINNATYGVNNLNSSVMAPLKDNWWGSSDGPKYTGSPAGVGGDWVSAYVDYFPYLTSEATLCGNIKYSVADFDGDGDTDMSLYRPSTGGWYVKDQFALAYGGAADDIPVPADYDGDGDTDVAVYRPSTGYWYVKDQFAVQYGGMAGDIPVPADYDGDGDTDVAIYRSSWGAWLVKDQFAIAYGASTDIPVPADYDGDGDADLGVYRPSFGGWYVKDQFALAYGGAADDIPLPFDYDGDGDADIAVYRPSTGYWYVKDQFALQYGGMTGDTPVPGDYDGDGDVDVAIYRTVWGSWLVKDQFAIAYGAPTDFPLPARDANGDGAPWQ